MRLNDTTGVLMQVTSDAWSVSGKRAQAAALVILQRGTSTESVRLFSPEFRISCIISLANVFKLKWTIHLPQWFNPPLGTHCCSGGACGIGGDASPASWSSTTASRQFSFVPNGSRTGLQTSGSGLRSREKSSASTRSRLVNEAKIFIEYAGCR